MNFFFFTPGNRYTAERLRRLHEDLLSRIECEESDDMTKEVIVSDDDEPVADIRRLTFRRKVQPVEDLFETTDRKDNKDLMAAFRMLAATRSADKEGANLGAVAVRDDASVVALGAAKVVESKVVNLIRSIGDVIIKGEKNHQGLGNRSGRSDCVFEYFCENNILSLLVDVAKETRTLQCNKNNSNKSLGKNYHGVVWSPLVKAQILQTISSMISNVQDHPVLYYLMSKNKVNELVLSMLPLQKWTDPALEIMIPAYVDLLRNIAVHLSRDPYLFPFLSIEQTDSNIPIFPLFAASLETVTCPYAQSDDFIYECAFNVLNSIMKTSFPSIRQWVNGGIKEQQQLADHLCQRLLDRFHRIVNLSTGPVVDAVRSNAVAAQLEGLCDQLEMINEIFWSGARVLNVQLCETLMQRVVLVLLSHLSTKKKRPFLAKVGVYDVDVIPKSEALAQVSTIFLSKCFNVLAYAPLHRMMAVAMLHPKSTITLISPDLQEKRQSQVYVIVPTLNDLIESRERDDICPNPFRIELLKAICGGYGDWRLVASAVLLESVIKADALDCVTLSKLEVIPRYEGGNYVSTAVEQAIAAFLERRHTLQSAVSTTALECIGSLAINTMHQTVLAMVQQGNDNNQNFQHDMTQSPIWRAFHTVQSAFAASAMEAQSATGVSDIFLDIVEAVIVKRYSSQVTSPSGHTTFSCLLSRYSCDRSDGNFDILVRKLRSLSISEVETARFQVDMALHFRSLCNVLVRLQYAYSETPRITSTKDVRGRNKVTLDLVDRADYLCSTIGGLVEKPEIGTDIDLQGRMTFRFSLQSNMASTEAHKQQQAVAAKNRSQGVLSPSKKRNIISDEFGFRPKSHLILVLDPTDMFIVEPCNAIDSNRGTVKCCISLRSVIAAAADSAWLHVAVRHDDVNRLIKNGNMALQFESGGTCLIVKQYLERSRQVLRRELLEKTSVLFGNSAFVDNHNKPKASTASISNDSNITTNHESLQVQAV